MQAALEKLYKSHEKNTVILKGIKESVDAQVKLDREAAAREKTAARRTADDKNRKDADRQLTASEKLTQAITGNKDGKITTGENGGLIGNIGMLTLGLAALSPALTGLTTSILTRPFLKAAAQALLDATKNLGQKIDKLGAPLNQSINDLTDTFDAKISEFTKAVKESKVTQAVKQVVPEPVRTVADKLTNDTFDLDNKPTKKDDGHGYTITKRADGTKVRAAPGTLRRKTWRERSLTEKIGGAADAMTHHIWDFDGQRDKKNWLPEGHDWSKDQRVQNKQKGGGVWRVPGLSSGDKVNPHTGQPYQLSPGSFVLNKRASNFLLGRQKGGSIPTNLEGGETVYEPGTWQKGGFIEGLNKKMPRLANNGPISEESVVPQGMDPKSAKAAGYIKGGKIFLHWAGSGYTGAAPGYHATVQGDGSVRKTGDYDTPGRRHTWLRNSQGIGISLAAMKGGSDSNFGSYPVKAIQYESMAKLVAQIASSRGWQSSDINVNNVMTHAEAASGKDGQLPRGVNYGPQPWGGTGERWDLWMLNQGDQPGTGGTNLRAMIRGKMGGSGAIDSDLDSGTTPGSSESKNLPFVFPFPKGRLGTGPAQVFGAPRDGGARMHAGVDLVEKTPYGEVRQPQVATRAGTVLQERYQTSGYTAGLMVRQDDGYDTRYVHMTPTVKPGQKVKPGDEVGKLVDLGQQTHLHYELYKKGSSSALDPTPYLQKAGKVATPNKSAPGKQSMPDGEKGKDSGDTRGMAGGDFMKKALSIAGTGMMGVGAMWNLFRFIKGMTVDQAGSILGLGSALSGQANAATMTSADDIAEKLKESSPDTADTTATATTGDSAKSNKPYDIASSIGFSKSDWDIYRNSVGYIESRNRWNPSNDEGGGSGGQYDGRWQMGWMAKTDAANYLGEEYVGHEKGQPKGAARMKFRRDPAMQERYFAAFTAKNHQYLSSHPKYKAMSTREKFEILGYAHNQGAQGAKDWLNTGVVGEDGFGTKADKYAKALRAAYGNAGTKTVAGKMVGGITTTPALLEGGETVFEPGTWEKTIIPEVNREVSRLQTGGPVGVSPSSMGNPVGNRFDVASKLGKDNSQNSNIIINNYGSDGGDGGTSVSTASDIGNAMPNLPDEPPGFATALLMTKRQLMDRIA